jgi:hypothetical protein
MIWIVSTEMAMIGLRQLSTTTANNSHVKDWYQTGANNHV